MPENAPLEDTFIDLPLNGAADFPGSQYGHVVKDLAAADVCLKPWPKDGLHVVFKSTNVGGHPEHADRVIRVYREGVMVLVDEFRGFGNGGHQIIGNLAVSDHSRIPTHVQASTAVRYPDSGIIFYPKTPRPYILMLALGDNVSPGDFQAFYFTGETGFHVAPSVWHQAPFPVGNDLLEFAVKEGRVFASETIDFGVTTGQAMRVGLDLQFTREHLMSNSSKEEEVVDDVSNDTTAGDVSHVVHVLPENSNEERGETDQKEFITTNGNGAENIEKGDEKALEQIPNQALAEHQDVITEEDESDMPGNDETSSDPGHQDVLPDSTMSNVTDTLDSGLESDKPNESVSTEGPPIVSDSMSGSTDGGDHSHLNTDEYTNEKYVEGVELRGPAYYPQIQTPNLSTVEESDDEDQANNGEIPTSTNTEIDIENDRSGSDRQQNGRLDSLDEGGPVETITAAEDTVPDQNNEVHIHADDSSDPTARTSTATEVQNHLEVAEDDEGTDGLAAGAEDRNAEDAPVEESSEERTAVTTDDQTEEEPQEGVADVPDDQPDPDDENVRRESDTSLENVGADTADNLDSSPALETNSEPETDNINTNEAAANEVVDESLEETAAVPDPGTKQKGKRGQNTKSRGCIIS